MKFTSGPGWPGRSPIAKESHLPSSTKKHQDNQKSCDSIVARAFSDLLVICLVCTGGYSKVEPAFHLYLRTTRKFQEMKSEERRNNVFFNKQLATCPPQQQTPTQAIQVSVSFSTRKTIMKDDNLAVQVVAPYHQCIRPVRANGLL